MIKLDDNLLEEIGLSGLPKEEKAAFLKHMYETLEMRVGTRLAEKMSDAQMTEFEQFINSNDEQGAFHWLESNFPNYKQVVAEEFDKLKAEITPLAPQILASSTAHAQQQPQPAPPAPQPQSSQPVYQPPAAPAAAPPGQPAYGAAPAPAPMQQPIQPAPAPAQQQPAAPPPQYPQPVQPPAYVPPSDDPNNAGRHQQ